MHLPRPILGAPLVRAMLLFLLPSVAAAGILLLWWQVHVRGLTRDMVQDTVALLSDPMPRPTHVSPALPGSFGELAAPHLSALTAAVQKTHELSEQDRALVVAILEGRSPRASLPPGVKRLMRQARPAVQGLLRATHAASAQPPACMLVERLVPPDRCAFLLEPIWLGGRLALLDARRLLAEGNADGALEEILDVLALARDLSYGLLIGDMVGAAIIRQAFSLCGEALDAASPAGKSYALLQLQRIQEARPGLAAVLKQDQRAIKPSYLLQAAPPAVTLAEMKQALLDGQYRFRTDPRHWLIWDAGSAISRRAQAAAMLPAARLPETGLVHLDPLQALAYMSLDEDEVPSLEDPYAQYDLRHRCASTRLHLLRAAALLDLSQSETHRFPASVRLSGVPGEPPLPAVMLETVGETLRVRAALSDKELRYCDGAPELVLHRDR